MKEISWNKQVQILSKNVETEIQGWSFNILDFSFCYLDTEKPLLESSKWASMYWKRIWKNQFYSERSLKFQRFKCFTWKFDSLSLKLVLQWITRSWSMCRWKTEACSFIPRNGGMTWLQYLSGVKVWTVVKTPL